MKLLQKLGWKEGEGLGKEGTGIKQPIQPKTVAQPGAGLGSSSSKKHKGFDRYYKDK